MKLLATAGLLSISAVMGLGQNNEAATASSSGKITLPADRETNHGGIIELRGHVQVVSDSMTVSADEADYDPLMRDLQTSGHVHIAFKKLTPTVKLQDASPQDLPATIPPRK